MSYSFPGQGSTKAGTPTTTDDTSKGYARGSQIVNTSVTPNTIYTCTSPTLNAAVWVLVGAALVAFANTVLQYDLTYRLTFASTPANAIASSGVIGGP